MAIELPALPGLNDPSTAYGATPQSIAAQRAYAKALMTGSVGKDGSQFPVVQSWTQGASNMVNALLGGLQQRNANEKEQNAIALTNSKPSSFSEGPSSEGREKADGDIDKESKAIASIESKGSGDYAALGPATRTGDRAYGKYQVMGANIPSWTKEALGREMTPEEFRSSPEAQEAVFKTKFPQGGNTDADRASVWFTGKPYAQGAGQSDGYINGAEYVSRFNKAMGQPAQGDAAAMSFAGPDGTPPAVTAMSAALRGKPAAVAQNNLPEPNGNGIYYDPRLVKPPPQYSPQQMQGVMNNPVLDPAAKAAILQQYRQQGQPIELPYPGGHVIIDPMNPTRQQFIPDLQKGTTKAGDIEVPNYQTLGPPGSKSPVQAIPVPQAPAPIGPRSDAAPAVAPQGAPPVAAPQAPTVAQNAPAAPAVAPKPPVTPPVQVASLDPNAGFEAAAKQAAPGMAAVGAPVVPAVNQTPTSPLTKLAANDDAIRALVGPQVYDAYKQKKDADVERDLGKKQSETNMELEKEIQADSGKAAVKKYDTLSTQAQAARKLMPNLDIAMELTKDPRFHSGIFAGPQDIVARLKTGLLGDAGANAPNEVFDKLMAGTVLDTMKTALAGLGQVRLAEIGLLTKANANRTNSIESNRAVLDISKRAVQNLDHLDSMGQQYASGDEVTDPVTGAVMLKANVGKDGEIAPRHGLDVGFDKLARKFTLDHPSFSPDEIKHYTELFEKKPEEAGKTQDVEGQPKIGEEKQFKQGIGVWDGKEWKPK